MALKDCQQEKFHNVLMPPMTSFSSDRSDYNFKKKPDLIYTMRGDNLAW